MDSRKDNLTTQELSTPPQTLQTISYQADTASQEQTAEKLAALARLQSHFYQPGQTSQQLRAILEDMLEDLAHLTPAEVQIACRRYRADGNNRFFPTPGQLLLAFTPPALPAIQRSSLKRFDSTEFNAPRCEKLKSVGQILRENGFGAAAGKWETQPVK